MRPLVSLLGLVALLGSAVAGIDSCHAQSPHVVWSVRQPNGTHVVWRTAEASGAGGSQVLLSGVEWVDLEVTNRTRSDQLHVDRSRRVLLDGIASIELPDGGALHAYRRAQSSRHGLFWVGPSGQARVVLEEPALPGGTTPFDDRIGVSVDGGHAAVPFLDGRVAIVRLDGLDFGSTGSPARFAGLPSSIETTSLCLLDTALVCGTEDDRVWQVPYADRSIALERTPTGVPNPRLKSEWARSGDGRSAVFLYGPRDLYTIFRIESQGPAVALPPPPSKYEEPGYLPEEDFGPRLLLDEDGSELLFIDGAIRDEAFALEIATGSITHVTGDHNFQPYIGVVILPFAIADSFVAGIGDPARFDLYATNARAPSVSNWTLTNGNTVPPFVEGDLEMRAIHATEQGAIFVDVKATGALEGALVEFGAQGPRTIVPRTISRPELGPGLAGHGDLRVESAVGVTLLDSRGLDPILFAPAGVQLSSSIVDEAVGSVRSRVALAGLGPLRAVIFQADGSAPLAIGVSPDSVGLGRTRSGALLLDGDGLRLFAPGGARLLESGSADRRILSGRSVRLP